MLEQESNHGSSHYSSNSATQPSFYVAFVNNKHVRTHQTQIYFFNFFVPAGSGSRLLKRWSACEQRFPSRLSPSRKRSGSPTPADGKNKIAIRDEKFLTGTASHGYIATWWLIWTHYQRFHIKVSHMNSLTASRRHIKAYRAASNQPPKWEITTTWYYVNSRRHVGSNSSASSLGDT